MKKNMNMRGQVCRWKIIAAYITTTVGLRYKLCVPCSSSSFLRLIVNTSSVFKYKDLKSILPREATLIRTAVRWESIISMSNSS